MIEPLKKTRLYEEIVKQLVELINKGTLKPGDRLPPERELAGQFHVSRTAIREALRALELMGFIDSKVGGGTFIRQVTLSNVIDPFSVLLAQDKKLILELIEVRQLLETELAKLAAHRIDDRKTAEIRAALDLMKDEIARGEIGIAGDNAFHDAVARAAENTAMARILAMCGDLLSYTRQATLTMPGQPQKSLADHQRIFEAIAAKDDPTAGRLMKEHLEKAQKNLLSQ
jgi:GntR family transcriptional regulator, transcriptional repressor for pyruvate dehydrogenase complex